MEFLLVAGVILAGGQSRRMGQDKARLMYCGQTLIDRAADILKAAGAAEIIISGTEFSGYQCLLDSQPFAGPAAALCGVLARIPPNIGILAIPVDMPLLDASLLKILLSENEGAHFSGWPLPVWIPPSRRVLLGRDVSDNGSVRALLQGLEVKEILIPQGQEEKMINVNTPEDWSSLQDGGLMRRSGGAS